MDKNLKKTVKMIDAFLTLAGIPPPKMKKRNVILKAGLLRTKGIKFKEK